VLAPVVEAWIARHLELEPWQRDLVRGLMQYEGARLKFVTYRNGMAVTEASKAGESWIALETSADFPALVRTLISGDTLDRSLLSDGAVLVTHEGRDAFAAYQLTTEQLATRRNEWFSSPQST
jgi:hypothetical protein